MAFRHSFPLKLASALVALLSGCGTGVTFESTNGKDATEADIRYLVVSLVPADSDFDKAVRHLAERHGCEVLHARPSEVESLIVELRRLQPNHVAFLVDPDDLEQNLVARVMKLSTKMDDDPFVDFAYGFITGRDGQAAMRLIDASISKQTNTAASIAQFGVASAELPKSIQQTSAWPLGRGSVPVTSYMSRGETDDTRDQRFIEESMVKMARQPILLFASHGYPNGLVGGPKAKDIRGRDFGGSVALNIACYTGVTKSWYEDDWATGQVRKHDVDREDSFCLQMIDNGVAGYVAYICPRPAGPTMMGDALFVATSGKSMGQLRQEDANSIVLAHLLSGSDSLQISEASDGTSIVPNRKPGESVRRWSTGGILIGDPAFHPFSKKPGSDPRIQIVTRKEDRILVDVKVVTPLFHFYCSDQHTYWEDSQPAMRLEAAVPLDDCIVKDVQLISSSFGDADHRLVAAVDVENGKRILRIKANFAQPSMEQLQKLSMSGVVGQFEILISKEATSSTSDRRVIRH